MWMAGIDSAKAPESLRFFWLAQPSTNHGAACNMTPKLNHVKQHKNFQWYVYKLNICRIVLYEGFRIARL